MAICKSCQIDLTKPPSPTAKFEYPKNIPVSKEMRAALESVRRDKNAGSSKSRRQNKR